MILLLLLLLLCSNGLVQQPVAAAGAASCGLDGSADEAATVREAVAAVAACQAQGQPQLPPCCCLDERWVAVHHRRILHAHTARADKKGRASCIQLL